MPCLILPSSFRDPYQSTAFPALQEAKFRDLFAFNVLHFQLGRQGLANVTKATTTSVELVNRVRKELVITLLPCNVFQFAKEILFGRMDNVSVLKDSSIFLESASNAPLGQYLVPPTDSVCLSALLTPLG